MGCATGMCSGSDSHAWSQRGSGGAESGERQVGALRVEVQLRHHFFAGSRDGLGRGSRVGGTRPRCREPGAEASVAVHGKGDEHLREGSPVGMQRS